MAQQPDYYETLGVALAADEAEIKRAYRGLAKRYHPDRVPPERHEWARGQMAEINAAYEVLSDPQRRTEYDRRRAAASLAGGHAVSGARWRASRARERMRRAEMERWQSAGVTGVAIVGVGLVLTLLWSRWVGLDSLFKQCALGGALALSALLVYAALKLTDL
jgi:curved DNA-binding protein CbpA